MLKKDSIVTTPCLVFLEKYNDTINRFHFDSTELLILGFILSIYSVYAIAGKYLLVTDHNKCLTLSLLD